MQPCTPHATEDLTIPFRAALVARVLQGARARPSTAHQTDCKSAQTSSGPVHFCSRLVNTPTRCGEHFAKLLVWWRKGAALPVDWLVESGSASCAARFGSIPHGRGRGHSRGCICAPHAYLCSPLSTIRCVCATCDRRRLLLLLWSSIDEQARPDAAACCSMPACIARSDQAHRHREQRHMSALPRF